MNGKINRFDLFYNTFIVKKKEEFSQMYASEMCHFAHFKSFQFNNKLLFNQIFN